MWKKVDTHASARHGSIHVSEFGKRSRLSFLMIILSK